MVNLSDIVLFCDERVSRKEFTDYPGAENGLQVSNNGIVTKIGAAVDAGLVPFEKAVEAKIDFLIVHHGLFWSPFVPITSVRYKKMQTLIEGNLAVYGSHLPLDAHQEIGNNAVMAKKLQLKPIERFLPFGGIHIGLIAEGLKSRKELVSRLKELFPKRFTSIEYGSDAPKKIAVCSGSGTHAINDLIKANVDTLITGELKQSDYNIAQEYKLNLYACGHYATEVFGVQELAKEVASKFNLPFEFIATDCLL